MEYWVEIKGNSLPVTVSFKEMKAVRLKVFPTRIIKLSVPLDTPETWISEYLTNKTPWIEKKMELFAQTRAIEKEEHFISGSTTRILGQQLMIQVRESPKKFIIQEDSVLFVFTPETDQQKIDAQINNWWQHTAKQHFQEVVDRLYICNSSTIFSKLVSRIRIVSFGSNKLSFEKSSLVFSNKN